MPRITLAWTAVSGASGYRIHAGLVPTIYTDVSANITPGSATGGYIDVPTAALWYLVVAALDALGYEGPYSAEVSKNAAALPPIGSLSGGAR